MTMPNFCINFLNKAEKSLPILYDFAVASLADAWIKMLEQTRLELTTKVVSLADAWIKTQRMDDSILKIRRIPRRCVD